VKIGELWRRLVFLVRKSRHQRELGEEMQFHLDMKAAEFGDPHAARRQFGNSTVLQEVSREMWGWNSIETLWQDVRYALRGMRRSPGFTAIVIATLALGIGANTAMFSIVDMVLLRPLPFRDQDRLVAVYSHFIPGNVARGSFSLADYLDLTAQNRTFGQFAAYTFGLWTISGPVQPEVLNVVRVTPAFFPILGAQPLIGRTFYEGEDKLNAPRVCVLSETLWRRLFSSDRNVIGRGIVLNDTSYTVVGVMPSGFEFPQQGVDIWTEMQLTAPTYRFPFFLRGIAKLKPGVTLEQAQTDLNTIAPGIERSDPKTYSHLSFPVLPLREGLVGSSRLPLLVLLGSVAMVLLIASVNVANLLLARAASREREIAIRVSIGAGRARVLRQLLTESLLLAFAGGLLGLILAWWVVSSCRHLTLVNIPRLDQAHIDVRVLLFTVAVCLFCGILFGLAPALESIRFRLNDSLKQHERSGTESRSRRQIRSALVMAEVALSFILLIGAGLLLRSFAKLQSVNPGFDTENLLVAQVSAPHNKYPSNEKLNQMYAELLNRLRALPSVQSVAASVGLPPARSAWTEGFRLEDRPTQEGNVNPSVPLPIVTPDYFRTLGIALQRGRYFSEHDTPASPPVVIISQTMAQRYFGSENPIGKRLMMGWSLPNQPWREIVGVVGDVKYRGLDAPAEAVYYVPMAQFPSMPAFLVLRAPNAGRLAEPVRAAIGVIDKDILVTDASTMQEAISQSVAQPRFRTALLGAFAGVALLLAAIGIYGVVAYSVSQRMHEFGIRIALGAQAGNVIGMVLGASGWLMLVGVAAGLAGSFALTRLLKALLFEVSPTDPLTFVIVAGGLAGIALLATLVPARRATRIDPVSALRDE